MTASFRLSDTSPPHDQAKRSPILDSLLRSGTSLKERREEAKRASMQKAKQRIANIVAEASKRTTTPKPIRDQGGHYRVLGFPRPDDRYIDPQVGLEISKQIRDQRDSLARQKHSDRKGGDDEEMKAINLAYETLNTRTLQATMDLLFTDVKSSRQAHRVSGAKTVFLIDLPNLHHINGIHTPHWYAYPTEESGYLSQTVHLPLRLAQFVTNFPDLRIHLIKHIALLPNLLVNLLSHGPLS